MQSAFMIDLNQVSLALRNALTPRSILVLDEFGKGTLPIGHNRVALSCGFDHSDLFYY
jgi:DNA mismatch repair ATPase MutS